MQIRTTIKNQVSLAVIESSEVLLTDVQSALDLMATVKYETYCTRFALYKEAVSEDFFRLSTQIAGEILQKFINYGVKFAVIGDFSGYSSKPLHDFIYESNQGRDIFFVPTEEEAVERLLAAR